MLQNSVRRVNRKRISHLLAQAWVMPVCFLGLGVATRLPFRAQLVQEWDAGCFALAVEHYDVRLEQPHRPGTFLIYILLARGIHWFLQDPTASLVWVSVVATGLAAAGMFVLARAWFPDRRIAWVAASLLLVSPIVWYYGEMPLSYAPELAWVLWTVLAATYTHRGSKTGLAALAILLALAGGIRPNTPIFLLPLALWSVRSGLRTRRFNGRQVAVTGLLGGLVLASWMLPLFETSGGAARYGQLIQEWLQKHSKDSDSVQELSRNVTLVIEVTLLGVGLALLPMLVMLVRQRRQLLPWLRSDWRSQALALWMIPGSLYLLFFHMQRYGHAFTVLPGMLLLAAICVVALSDGLQRYHRQAGVLLIGGVIGCNALIFPFGPSSYYTWERIRKYDLKYLERIEFIRSHFPAETTVVVAHPLYGRLPDVYLPQYQERHLSRLISNKSMTLPNHVRTLVLLDNKIYKGDRQEFQWHRLPRGGKIRYLTWSADRRLRLVKRQGPQLIPAEPDLR
jgi:hypothetical protein